MAGYQGRNAYIVGGSSGIGLALAAELARRGANLCLLARRLPPLEEARRQALALAPDPGQRVLALPLDVRDHALTRRVVARAAAELGRPHLAVNCAGEAHPRVFEDITPEQFGRTLEQNLAGAFNLASAVLPLMRAGDRLVNVASLAGLLGVYGYGDYCAAKFGLVGLSAALRCECAPRGIKVAVLCPGDTETPGLRREREEMPPLTRALSARAGLMPPEAVARALLAGLERERFLIVPGLRAKLIVLAQRLCPGLVWRVMRRDLDRAGRAGG